MEFGIVPIISLERFQGMYVFVSVLFSILSFIASNNLSLELVYIATSRAHVNLNPAFATCNQNQTNLSRKQQQLPTTMDVPASPRKQATRRLILCFDGKHP